jgi:site-specific recombinase XerD
MRLRTIAIVEILRATGCRVGELCGLRTVDLDPEYAGATVRGKGKKYRKVWLDDRARLALGAYLTARHVEAGQDVPLFVSHRKCDEGKALSDRHVGRTILKLAKIAGVEHVTPHYFRHVFATRALERTGNLALIQDMMGHASPVTTRVYAKTNAAQAQAAHERIWAEGNSQ